MKPHLSIPREALAELLRASGSTLTPEQYVASLPVSGDFSRYPSRAWAAAGSKYFLLVVALLAVIGVPFLGFDVENLVIVIGLVTVTFFEYRVHRYFRECNPAAPVLGFRNQAGFALGIVLYCLYSAFFSAQLPAQDMNLIEENNIMSTHGIENLERIFYLFIAILAGGSQFALACFYRGAAVSPGR